MVGGLADSVVALLVLVLFLRVTTVHVFVLGMLSNSGGKPPSEVMLPLVGNRCGFLHPQN